MPEVPDNVLFSFCFLQEKFKVLDKCKQYLYPFSVKAVRYYLMNDEKCLVANKYDPILCNKFTIGGLVQPHWILKSIQMVANRSLFKGERPIFPCKNMATQNPNMLRFALFGRFLVVKILQIVLSATSATFNSQVSMLKCSLKCGPKLATYMVITMATMMIKFRIKLIGK